MNTSASTIMLLSGGMDSAACAHYLQKNGQLVRAVFVDYGQRAAIPEVNAAERIAGILGLRLWTMKLESSQSFGCGEIPGRNAFLILGSLMILGHEKPSAIAIGIHSGTPYYDCSPAFVETVGHLVSEYTDGRTRVVAPFVDWTKQEIFDYCGNAGIPVELTYSCEAGGAVHCGLCLSCRDRRILDCPS